ncbi:hypothetical protein FGIG_08909 [Fasciola gigantica]|uniref:Uncharacterized protein n=1 Tax=Fasciola gigantica TaxID=46835 RepID=A0A504YEF9_FASGI|nr:hypothetical protein FGIG_08909 [Fasciola gigantica]
MYAQTELLDNSRLKKQEVLRFVEKKEERKRNHSTTLGDYHAYNIEVLKHEREEMLRQSAEREKDLFLHPSVHSKTVHGGIKATLAQLHPRAQIYCSNIQKVRKQQELEIEKLTRTARQLRTEFSQNVNQLKEELQHAADDLDRTGQMELKQSTMRAQQESIRLVVEKMQQIQDENRLLRDEIWTTRQNIHALEKHLDRVTEDHKQLRRINVQVMDLDYLEKKRLDGLLTLHHPNTDHIDQCL